MKYRIFLLFCLPAILFLSCRSHNETAEETSFPSDTSKVFLENINTKIKENPDDAGLYDIRARYYMRESQFDLALKDINKATTLDPKNPVFYLSLSDVYLLMGKTTNCGDALNKALSLDPKNNEAFLRMARLNLIIREYKTSMEYIRKALGVQAVNPQAYYTKALVLLETGDTVKAVDDLKKAVDQNQNYFEALMELGQLYSMRKDPMSAGYYKNAIRIKPKNREANYNLGMFYQETGQYENAILTYTNLEKIDTTYRNAPYNIGYIYLVYLKDFKKAALNFTEAIRRDPGYFEAYFNRGYAYELDGQYENASKDYHRALEIKVNYQNAIDGLNRLDKVYKKR
jgi:Tfp pilus assembly protein PilF